MTSASNPTLRKKRAPAHREKIDKVCVICSKPFQVFYSFRNAKVCSRACSSVLHRKTLLIKKCPICEKEYGVLPSNEKMTCSARCGAMMRSGEGHHRWIKDREKVCLQCGEKYDGAAGWKRSKRFCGVPCYNLYTKINGWAAAVPIGTVTQDPDGYKRIKISRNKWKPEHVFIVEKAIGRVLTRAEVVHHRNGNHGDNRIENLQVVSRQQHMRIHHEAEQIGLKVMAGEIEIVKSIVHPLEGVEV